MLDALSLLNVHNTHHLEHLAWAVYDVALLVGVWPELPGSCPWCTVLAGLYKHICRGCKDMAHCPPYMLASWDCQERIEVLHREGRLGSAWGGQWRASRPRRYRSSSQHCSQTPAQGDRNERSHSSSPCTPSRCHCRAALSPNANTMPKLASAVNVPSHVLSSHSYGEMAQASLDDEDTWEDDLQTPHMPVHCIVQWDAEPATGRIEASRGSPSWHPCYQVDIGEEQVTLKSIDPTWRATCWLQLVVQSITNNEVPWYELVIPLTSGMEGAAQSLAKRLLVMWRWSLKVQGEGICPPTPTVLNIGHFMTTDEVAKGMGEAHWFVTYSHALEQVGKAARRWKWEWPAKEALEVKVSPLVHAFWEETDADLTMACLKLCWEPAP